MFWGLFGCAEPDTAPGSTVDTAPLAPVATAPALIPPNVIMIAVDGLRADRLGVYGHDADTSLALDRLAAGATVFERAYATAPWTLPSMGSVMTGQPPSLLGVTATAVELSGRYMTLAERLRRAGYGTEGVVSQPFLARRYGFARGFDRWNEKSAHDAEGDTAAVVTNEGIAAVERMKEKPFFLFLHYRDVGQRYVEQPNDSTGEQSPDPYAGPVRGGQSIFDLRDLVRAEALEPRDWRRIGELYDANIRDTDRHIGEFLEHLTAAGLMENLLVVFVSGHGVELGEGADRWIGATKTVSEEVLHVPLLMKMPGQSAARRVKKPVSLVDVTPTILAAVGLNPSAKAPMFGAPIDFEDPADCARPVFAETRRWGELQAVYCGDWKLIYDTGLNSHELYRRSTDPRMQLDLSESSEGWLLALEEMRREWERRQERAAQGPSSGAHAGGLDEEQRLLLRRLGYLE